MMDRLHSVLIIAVAVLVTAALRFLPFLIFNGKKETPPFIRYLSTVLPYAIMAMLVVFCLKNVSLRVYPHGLPELIAGGAVASLHAWRRNTLLSIAAGTILYMVLIQFVFV